MVKKEKQLNIHEEETLINTIVGGLDGSYFLGRDPNNRIMDFNEQFYHQKHAITVNYARKINKGKFDKDLAKKGVKNLLVTPVARQIQNMCKKKDTYEDPLYCDIPDSIRDKASDMVLEQIESEAKEMIKDDPESLKIRRSRN